MDTSSLAKVWDERKIVGRRGRAKPVKQGGDGPGERRTQRDFNINQHFIFHHSLLDSIISSQ
jgi:hypothetical protein